MAELYTLMGNPSVRVAEIEVDTSNDGVKTGVAAVNLESLTFMRSRFAEKLGIDMRAPARIVPDAEISTPISALRAIVGPIEIMSGSSNPGTEACAIGISMSFEYSALIETPKEPPALRFPAMVTLPAVIWPVTVVILLAGIYNIWQTLQ